MEKIATVPNALTLLRGCGIPLFIYLALNRHADTAAIIVLMIAGATDYLDGKLARAWNQTSRLGELMDPAIDRLYIASTLIVLYIRDALPLWMVVVILGRDLILALLTMIMMRYRIPPFSVTYLGKAATFSLLYAFPLLLLALSHSWLGKLAFVIGWSFAIWGITLYLYTGASYFRDGWRSIALAK
jgi:cardiolipin synthase